MNAETRRKKIVAHLSRYTAPVSATALSNLFGVSRQVIVGDIALLRAAGEDIAATPRGYVLLQEAPSSHRTVAVCHNEEQTEQELCIFVDNGCVVEDVVVEHHVYGEIRGRLHLTSRYDVSQFIRRMTEKSGTALSSLTNGIHLHTLSCPNEEAYDRVCNALREAGILLEQDD